MTEPTFDFDGGGLGQDLGVPVVVIPKKTLPPRWPTLTRVPIVIDTGLRPTVDLTVAVDGSRTAGLSTSLRRVSRARVPDCQAGTCWSSQSKMRSPRMPLPAGSQCESAPSSSVNRTSALLAGSFEYSCCDWPGQNCSWPGSVTRTGQVICPITSSVSE